MNGQLVPAPTAQELLSLPDGPDVGSRTLGEVEREIEGGWVAAASGYREIREGRLYLQVQGRYDDFEHYTRARWGVSRFAVDKMIQAFTAVEALRKNFPEISAPENEGQARALLPLVADPSAMAEVLGEARRQAALRGTGVTAQRLAAGVRRRLASTVSPEPGAVPPGAAPAPSGGPLRGPEDEAFEGTRRALDETVAGFARLSQALSAHVSSVDLTEAELRQLGRLIRKAQALAQAGGRLAVRARDRRTSRGGAPLTRTETAGAPGAPKPGGAPARILAALRARGPSTTRELAEALGMELHVISGRLPGLRERGWVRLATSRRARGDGRSDAVYEAIGES